MMLSLLSGPFWLSPRNFLECYEHPSAMHSPVGNATEYARRKGKLVGFFRQPEQRVLSAYYDGHGWLEDFSNPDSSFLEAGSSR